MTVLKVGSHKFTLYVLFAKQNYLLLLLSNNKKYRLNIFCKTAVELQCIAYTPAWCGAYSVLIQVKSNSQQ